MRQWDWVGHMLRPACEKSPPETWEGRLTISENSFQEAGGPWTRDHFGKAWRPLWWLRFGVLLASRGWGQEMMLSILQCTGWPTTENDPTRNVHGESSPPCFTCISASHTQVWKCSLFCLCKHRSCSHWVREDKPLRWGGGQLGDSGLDQQGGFCSSGSPLSLSPHLTE